jgi:hypothetical protein
METPEVQIPYATNKVSFFKNLRNLKVTSEAKTSLTNFC